MPQVKKTTKELKRVGARIREIRSQRGWTLEECEQRGWKCWRHLQKLEMGKNMTVSTLLGLAALFGVHPSEFFIDGR